jgi:hypothetical protein
MRSRLKIPNCEERLKARVRGFLATFTYRHRTQILSRKERARRIAERHLADMKNEEQCAEEDHQGQLFAGARR